MALFGSSRDISFVIGINKELINDIVQQEVHYYKLYLPETKSQTPGNLYGEASAQKTYFRPVRLSCLVDRPGADTIQDDQIGIDTIQTVTFNFLRPQLEELGLVPQVGDIIETFDFFYEVDNTQEAQFFFGKDRDHPKSVGSEFGVNLSILCTTHLTRITRLQIIDNRV